MPELSLRDKILDISRGLLLNNGYYSISMRKIASQVGVSATSIYLHFESKEHLVHTLIEEAIEELSTALEKSTENKTSTIEKFHALIEAYMDFGITNPEKYEVIYMVKSDAMGRYPKEKFRKVRKGFTLLESIIREGVSDGVMDVEDPMMAAYIIWAQMHGVISVILNQRLDSRIEGTRFIEESAEQIIQGFLVRTTII